MPAMTCLLRRAVLRLPFEQLLLTALLMTIGTETRFPLGQPPPSLGPGGKTCCVPAGAAAVRLCGCAAVRQARAA